jgi:hypothetical protein
MFSSSGNNSGVGIGTVPVPSSTGGLY